MQPALLQLRNVRKVYRRGLLDRVPAFSLEAGFSVDAPAVIGVMGPNGSGKTTLFELIAGSNMPTSGEVLVRGVNIHRVKYAERDRLAIHYHQSYQVRQFRRLWPSIMLQSARSDYPLVHLFDEPQFNTSDGYIGFMLKFFRKLRREGRVVFICLHPNERYHVDIMREVCERFIFVRQGTLTHVDDWPTLMKLEPVRAYLGTLAEPFEGAASGAPGALPAGNHS